MCVAKSSVSAKLKQYIWALILIGHDCPYQDQSYKYNLAKSLIFALPSDRLIESKEPA